MAMATMKLCECGCGQPAPVAKQSDPRTGAVKGQPQRFLRGHNGGEIISASLRGNRHNFKGDDVTYFGLHNFVRRNFEKTGVCEECGALAGARAHDWASIEHRYTRDRSDWRELCRRCHKKYDYDNGLIAA